MSATHRAVRSLVLPTLAAVLGAAPLAAQRAPAAPATPAPAVAELDAYVARAVRDWKVPGLAIAVVKDDSVVLAKGYGVRELGKPDAVDAGTRFAIGSTTKAMTVVALGMLVDEGKVKWDDKVITHLPDFRLSDPYVTRELTVRDLLTHRAGLGNADMLWAGSDYSYPEIARRIGNLPPAYSLRSGFIYQNIMYAVAGDVVRAASGMSWEAFLRTRIFTPLGMTATEATLAGVTGKPNVATPHGQIRDTIRTVANRAVDPVAPAGSVWSSVGDMAKWMRFVLDSGRVGGKRLLTEATYREIFSPQVVAPTSMYETMTLVKPHFFTYGLGWFMHDYAGEAVTMHTGSINGMSAIIGLLPDRRVGVYVLANLDHAEVRHALMYRVFDMYRGGGAAVANGGGNGGARDWSAELLTLYGGLHERALAAEREQEKRRVTGTRPSLPLERYAGRYTDPTFGDLVVSVRDGVLQVAFGRRYVGSLEHWQYDSFRARWTDATSRPAPVVFSPDGTGGVARVRALGVTFARVPSGS